MRSSWDRCVASWYRLVHKPNRSASWMVVRHFSSLNRMKSNCTSYSSCLQRVRRATRMVSDNCCSRRRLTRLSWINYFVYRQSVNASFTCISHDSVDAFLDCLHDWAQGLRHSQFLVDSWLTQNAVCHCPVADQSYPLFGFSLTECRYFHILSTCYEPVWQILELKELMV